MESLLESVKGNKKTTEESVTPVQKCEAGIRNVAIDEMRTLLRTRKTRKITEHDYKY